MRFSIFLITVLISTDLLAQPKGRHLEDVAFDQSRQALILFGGVENHAGKFTESTKLFEWSGGDWDSLEVSGPCPRRAQALFYDPANKITTLMGGVTGDSILHDTWSWNGTKWVFVDSNCPVKSPRAIYDPANSRVLVYGDAFEKTREWISGMDQKFELWEFKNAKWRRLSEAGPQPSGPYAITYDSRKKALVFPAWENNKMTMWYWATETWSQQTVESGPAQRNRFAIAYHEKDGAVYFFGGVDKQKNFMNDFWRWTRGQWEKMSFEVSPGPRGSLNMEYVNNKLLLYGGVSSNGKLLNEMWQWDGKWKLLR
jgi:hypothetical protein